MIPLSLLISLAFIIEIDLKNEFNSHSRQAAFDTLAGVAIKDYVGAGVLYEDDLPHLAELQKFFP